MGDYPPPLRMGKMLNFLIVTACVVFSTKGQTQDFCCPLKEVSGPNGDLSGVYRLHPGAPGGHFPEDCKDSCVYRRENDPSGTNYCFMAGGGMESVHLFPSTTYWGIH